MIASICFSYRIKSSHKLTKKIYPGFSFNLLIIKTEIMPMHFMDLADIRLQKIFGLCNSEDRSLTYKPEKIMSV